VRHPFGDLEDTRESVHVFGDHPDDSLYQRLSRNREAITTGFYTRMFIEDVQYVVPFPRQDSSWEATLVGDLDNETRKMVTEALPNRHGPHPRRTLTEAYRDFSARCAQTMVAAGSAAYEIVYYFPDAHQQPAEEAAASKRDRAKTADREAGPQDPVAFSLMPVSPYVRGLSQRHLQYVPALETEDVFLGKAEPQPPRWIELDPDRIVVFELPRERRRQVARAWNGLVRASELYGSPPRLLMSGNTPDYDIETHKRTADETVARATRDVGWNAGMLFGKRQLEPYQLHRQLRFARFKVELRDTITTGINEALNKAGPQLGFETRMELRGVPLVEDVDNAFRDLDEGPLGKLVELYERFHPL
jgi:hypothetical protein